MYFRDSLQLAITKFKTRRIRLAIAVIVSGLMFIAFSTASMVMRGSIASINSFTKEGFAGRYITTVNKSADTDYTLALDKDVIAAAKEADKKLIADKKAEATRLGIEYDANSEQLAVLVNKDNNGSGQQEESVNTAAPQIQSYIHQKIVNKNLKVTAALNAFSQNYNTLGIYKGIALSNFGPPTNGAPAIPTINLIKKGTEVTENNQQNFTNQGIDSFKNGWFIMDDQLITPFMLPNQSLTIDEAGTIPLVAPYSAVEEMLTLPKLPNNATSAQKLDRLKEVRAKATQTTLSVCLRNQTSVERLQQAISQQQDIAKNKGNKDFVKPDLIYDKTETPCADIVVAKDTRDYDTKALSTKKDQFDQKFGKIAAAQRQVRFRIIGIVADPPNGAAFSVESLIGELLTSNLGTGWFTPRSALVGLPEYQNFVASQDEVMSFGSVRYVELKDAAAAKKFVNEQTCTASLIFSQNGPEVPKQCEDNKQYFTVVGFGSNSVALDQIREGFSKYFLRVLLFASIFSALILMGTVGRVMADSRRETAVFRAIGAKRLDIAQIYITYVVLIGVTISTFALASGYALAFIFDAHYSSGLTVKALLAYNATDLSRHFHTIAIDRTDLSWLVLIIMAGSLVSALIPLLSNLKRNPISDMRDER